MASNPSPSAGRSTTLRLVGLVLVVGGVVLAIVGGRGFFADEAVGDDLPFAAFGLLAAGLFAVVFGLGALSFGTVGARARYVADETAPAMRTTGEALGLRGAEHRTGTFCTECGRRGSEGAKFCDSCGTAMR